MLVFGRLSADSEITAMRACGVSILQIVSPIMLITVLLTALCLYLQVEVGPPLLGKSRALIKNMGLSEIKNPAALFEPGKRNELKNLVCYVDDREGESRLKGIQIYVVSDKDDQGGQHRIMQDISAKSGDVHIDKEKMELTVCLYDCMIDNRDSGVAGGLHRMYAEKLEFNFDYGKEANAARLWYKPKYMRLAELMGEIRRTKSQPKNNDTTELEVEMNQRIAFALAPIAFLLLGLPLAIRTNRRETSIGLFLSVILAGIFFLAIILCESFCTYPWLYPQYLLWLPNIIYQIAGAVMTYRVSQR